MKRAWIAPAIATAASLALAASVWRWARSAPHTYVLRGETYELLEPRMLLIAAILPFLALGLRRSLADLPLAQRWLGFVARSVVVVTLALALARPARTTETTDTTVVVLVDVSESVTDAALVRARRDIERIRRAAGRHDVRVVTFARTARLLELPDDATVPRLPRHTDERANGGAATDIESALQLAYGLFEPGRLRRVVLFSDGAQTHGDLVSEASRAARLGVRVFTVPYRGGVPTEVAVKDVATPSRIKVGEPFYVRARVFSTSTTRARLKLYQGDTLNGLDGIRDVDLPKGEHDVEFKTVVRVPGPVTYRAVVEPQGADRFKANNTFESTALVPGRPAVLYVEGNTSRTEHLARALTTAEFDVDVRSPRAIPTGARDLERFDFMILSDVAADQVSLSQLDAIERFVRDSGGGFMMAGGERGFGLGGWQGTRMERLLPVRMDAERRRDQPTLALALVIDKSGSMSGQKIELAKDAAKATAELLSADDYISVIGFDSQPERLVRMQSAGNRVRILRDIGRMAPRGGTAIFPALDAAYQELAVTRAKIKHVILLTDGQSPEQGISDLVQLMRSENITVSSVGLGADVNRGLLQQIATLGLGRSYFTNDPHNVPRIFMRETTTVARSAAVEEYVRPLVVTPADFLRGIDMGTAPFLQGYVATRAKPSPAQVILESELREPLLARWRVGVGWSLAWTSDLTSRWSVQWLRWPGFSRFWAQLVREHMRQRRTRSLDMKAELVGDNVLVRVDAMDEQDRFLNGLESQVSLSPSRGPKKRDASKPRTLPLRQTAPGLYEARFPLNEYGAFTLTAVHKQNGRPIAESATHVSNPYPHEYAALDPDLAALSAAARTSGGDVDPEPGSVFEARGEKVRKHEPLWPWFAIAALVLWVLDILLRRVRLFDARFERPLASRRPGRPQTSPPAPRT